MQRLAFLAVVLATTTTAAEPARQVQADVGLTVIHAAYEEPIGEHWAFQVEGGVFGTYFLPWFDLGDDVRGWGGGTRVTWFSRSSGSGPYIAPYLRVARINAEDETGVDRNGVGIFTGVFAGWAFRLTDRLDLRLGLGAQYIHLDAPPLEGASTPFVAIDGVVGYRL